MDTEEFRAHAHRVVDWMADYLRDVEGRRILPAVRPGEIRRRLPAAAPEAGEGFETLLADFERIVMPGMTHWQHPGWHAYFPANSSPPAILGEMLAAALGAQCMSWQTAPAATELEQVVLDWLRQLLGLPDGLAGVIQDTASTATLTAALTARRLARERAGPDRPLVFYASEEANASVFKAARLADFTEACVRAIPTDEAFAMRPGALEEAMAADARAGRIPCCVVATVGTTASTGMDPLPPIAEACGRHGAFLHVDAAYAGAAAVAPEFRGLLEGVGSADSFVVNPHKWLLTNFDCSAYYVRDADALRRTCSLALTPEYLRTEADQEAVNFRDWGIPLGRRFRALKLWFVLRSYGAEGLRALVREHVRLARLFAAWVDADPEFERLAPVPVGLVCFRHRPRGMADARLNEHNRAVLERVNRSGRVFLTQASLQGRFAIRLVVGQRTTTERHVREAWEIVKAAARAGDGAG